MLAYMLMFAIGSILCVNEKSMFIPLSFDSGGVTTGPVTVPFIMALGVGIAMTIGGNKAEENSFGMIALCSVGERIGGTNVRLCKGGSDGFLVLINGGFEKALRFVNGVYDFGIVGILGTNERL